MVIHERFAESRSEFYSNVITLPIAGLALKHTLVFY